jgi:O-methyltransferase
MDRNNVRRIGKRAIEVVARTLPRQQTVLGQAVKYAADCANVARYEDLFLSNGKGSKYGESVRASIIKRFRRIDKVMDIRTTPTDGLFLAEALLSLECLGAVVECGCFNGGSTAKLSIVAAITGRKMFVFDSFEGLPEADSYNTFDLHARRSVAWTKRNHWQAGRYAARLDAVKTNIDRHGEPSVCTFIKGWFNETLGAGLPQQVSLAFTDVDLASSAQECLVRIWPRLSEGGIFFSHDIAYLKVLQAFNDEGLWRETFSEHPPIFFGAGFGMCDSSPHLGFAVKGRVTADYIKSLTCDK